MHSQSTTPSRWRLRRARMLGACLSLCVGGAAFAASEPSLINGQKKSYGYSWQQELKLGADADKEMVEEMGVYDDPALQAYVQQVGERVLQASNFTAANAPEMYRDTKFTFRVMDSPVVNAFALPGGYVYVTRGLLANLDNEAQLAVVLGHEIGHVAARHSSQQARRSQWSQLGVIAGAILGQAVLGERMPDIGQTVLGAGGQAMQMFMLRYSREAELEADQLGVNYAEHSGYNAVESARFFHALQQLSQADGKALPTWQSTHPDPGDRADRVVQLAAQIDPQHTANNIGTDEYLKHIENIVVGEDPRAGFAQNGMFYHPELQFQMPVAAGWKLENQRAAVILAEPNGNALMGLRLAPGSRARDAATNFVQENKVQVAASGDTSVNGLPASVIVGQATTDQGAVGVWNAFIEMNGRVFSLLGYAPAQAFEQFRPTFESVASGFSQLRSPALASVEPTRLKLVRADRRAPFASFVPVSLPPDLKAENVAILNQVDLNEPVPAGTLLKIPSAPPRPSFARAPLQNSRADARRDYPNNYPGYPDDRRPDRQSRYPQNYPPQSYPPAQTYPQQTYPQSYPPQAYPPGNYPPQNPTSYPPPNTYPPQNYPGSSSSSSYPPESAPTSSGYPPTYPPQNYPPPYPSSSYPSQQPQFPQPPGATGSNPQPSPSQPAWPR